MVDEREERAFEALIYAVTRLETGQEFAEEDIHKENLPELTEKELAAMRELGPDIASILGHRGTGLSADTDGGKSNAFQHDLAAYARGDAAMTPELRKQLEAKRREVMERLKRKKAEETREQNGDADEDA